jgi:hypothetical protein
VWLTRDFSEVSTIPCFAGVNSLVMSNATNPPSLISGHNDGVIKVSPMVSE